MNAIRIALVQDSYKSGETINGALYVKVTQPTPATSVVLHFHGYEHYYYSCIQLEQHTEEDVNRTLQQSTEHFPAKDVTVLSGKESIPIGCYAFPFQLLLPADVPGSCHLKSESGPFWAAHIMYKLEAEFADCGRGLLEGKVEREIWVQDRDLTNDYGEVRHCLDISRFITKRQFITTISLNRQHYMMGENVGLNIDFTKTGFANDTSVEKINIQLKRRIELSINYMDKQEIVNPMGADKVLWESPLRATTAAHLINSIENLLIPIPSEEVPTTTGHFLKCTYFVRVEVELTKNKSVHLEVPLSVHSQPANRSHSEPDWASDCQLQLTQHPAMLPANAGIGFFRSRMPVLYEKMQETLVMLDDEIDSIS